MANILVRKTAHHDVDPFTASDRVSSSGKGDRPRNLGSAFSRNYDEINWHRKGTKRKDDTSRKS
jgi:hypothetical protein